MSTGVRSFSSGLRGGRLFHFRDATIQKVEKVEKVEKPEKVEKVERIEKPEKVERHD